MSLSTLYFKHQFVFRETLKVLGGERVLEKVRDWSEVKNSFVFLPLRNLRGFPPNLADEICSG